MHDSHCQSEVPTALRTMAAAPLSCLLALYSSAVALLLSILGVYHAILIGINQVTRPTTAQCVAMLAPTS